MMNQMLDDTSTLDFTTDYNWDNLSIGNHTNASSVFFAQRHPEHSAAKAKKYESKIKTKETHANNENVENNENNLNPNGNSNVVNTPQTVDSDYLSSEIESIQLNNVPSSPLRNNNRANLRTEPITPKAKDYKKDNKDFNVVRAGKLYEERKKQRMEELERIEREKRKFHSKPAPNFRAIHAAQEHNKIERPMKVTIPTTPLAIKHDREHKQRWQKRREEYEESRKPKPFISHGADVLKQKPFIPNLEKKSSTELEPFNLHSSERCKERRQFDEQIKMETERKKKEEEERRQQEEERTRRELRKQTNFKAQPNPFK